MQDEITFQLLGADNCTLLVQADIFDNPVDPKELAAFVTSSEHELIFAMSGSTVIGMGP